MTIGSNIKQLRKQAGLTQIQLANKSNISRSYLADVENDRYNASLETLKSISNALNVNLNNILDNNSNEASSLEESELNNKDKKDIEKSLNKTMEILESQEGLMLSGNPVDEEDWDLIKAAIQNGLEYAKKMNKQKYTPKKYRK